MQPVLTVTNLASLMGVSDRLIRKKINDGEFKATRSQTAEGKGRPGYVVHVSSLPVEVQRKYWTSNSEVTPVVADQEPTKVGVANKPISGISYTLAELKHAVGAERFEEMLAEAECKVSIIEQALNPPRAVERTAWINQLAAQYGKSPATLYRDIEKFQEWGILGLMRKSRLLTQGPQRTSIDLEVERFMRAKYLDRRKSKPAHIYRETTRFCETNGYKVPSRASVFRYFSDMEDFEPDLCCLAREGNEAYMKKFAEKATRKEPDFVNQVWEGDHHKLDLFISYQGRAVRPWITVWFDVCSRTVVGWCLSINANGRTIALALRHAMLPKKILNEDGTEDTLEIGGMPGMLYIDNGEDYKAQVRAGKKHEDWELSRETRSICASQNIKVQFATPYHPWAKGHVERFFGTFTDQFTRYQPGWCGANNKARPEDFDEKKLNAKGELLDLDELTVKVEAYLYDYHSTEHRTIGTTPLQKHFSTSKIREGFADERALDICLMDIEQASVTANGIERFGTRGRRRWYSHEKLPAYAGQKVIIRYDPNRIGELLIFHPKSGKYLFTATNKELLDFNASLDDIKEFEKRRAQRKKLVKQLITDTRITIESVTDERKMSGTRVSSGASATGKGNVRTMLGTEQVVKQREDQAKSTISKRSDKPISAFDAYILREGTEG
ncbi:Mu transposase C-terminal domain-containing protein [Cohnella silvisoli]|uniref:Mu transposase C-terminal domain-containing protein n=1 Tax=Cohnella silvisoli TaxID=2873699 RepID=A0ABV1L2C3_9BACL|nr:Mu transposase C-terminal domain-containing protein [Cohnella silvisoli]MCD9025777.1 Mu transposase C-terminal domain-containing protein [Cohnella silvisoli]